MGGDRINFELGDNSLYHSVVGKLYTEEPEPSVIAFSPLKMDDTPSPDWYPALNVLDMSNYGIYDIYGIKIVGDFVYVIGENKSIRMLMTPGIVPSFKVQNNFDFLGTNAINSIIPFKDGIIGAFKNGIYFVRNTPTRISLPIENTTTPPIGQYALSGLYTCYYPNKDELYIASPTDTTIYRYSFETQQWAVDTMADAIQCMFQDDGLIYGADSSKIYRLDHGTTDDGTSLNPSWKSKIYNVPKKEMILDEVEITYTSNTVFDFDVYINRSTAASWNASSDNQFAAAASGGTARKKFPNTFRGNEFEFGISIPSASRASNTSLEIDKIYVKGHLEDRID